MRRAAEFQPHSYKARITLAEFYLTPEHYDETAAETLGRVALEQHRGRIDAYCILASILASRALFASLDALLASALEAVPDDATPFFRAAERLLAEGRDPARAERYLLRYLAQADEGRQFCVASAQSKLALARRARAVCVNATAIESL